MTTEVKVFGVVVVILAFAIFFSFNLGKSNGKAEQAKVTETQLGAVIKACYTCAPQCQPTPEPDTP